MCWFELCLGVQQDGVDTAVEGRVAAADHVWVDPGYVMIPRDSLERAAIHPAVEPACVCPCWQGVGPSRVCGVGGAVPAAQCTCEARGGYAGGAAETLPMMRTHP